ncbi:hypothetical protein SISNIDRAFT_452222 [Sistotremastrum niveocremeum HHB9708]|uniref:Uncharacterized protein n=1 Tax=Sistotremastrum niveocremeum HHB9708 TaxID=1314777 RepID=A0A164X282_9AGAM|nr:hypothetical protein SISNIDRAFT_452222 [Sistotremastrum niveocremeum HHB9708]
MRFISSLVPCLLYLALVRGQISTPIPEGTEVPQSSTTTSAPNEITDAPGFSESTYPATITECYLAQTVSGTLVAVEGFPGATDLPDGAECFEIIREGTLVAEIELFTVGPGGDTVTIGALSTASPSPSPTPAPKKSHSAAIAASVSAVGGLILVGLFIIWLRHRRRTSSASQMASSRAGAWVRRSGWVKDEKVAENEGIALEERKSPVHT